MATADPNHYVIECERHDNIFSSKNLLTSSFKTPNQVRVKNAMATRLAMDRPSSWVIYVLEPRSTTTRLMIKCNTGKLM
jgi:hypothetical protein